ncbi:MAG: hypothetical protein Q9O74_09240 [Planctomycetota bacterium]|nr:hypothetical protein [Planctomycetota bacterium]
MTNTPHTTPPRIDSLDGLGSDLLSPAARARRDALRPDVEAVVRARGIRRVVVRSVAAVVLLTSATTLAVVANRGTPPLSTPQGTPANPGPSSPLAQGDQLPHPAASPNNTPTPTLSPTMSPAVRSPTLVGYVVDDPSVLDRFAASDTPSRVTTLDDRELLEELRAAGLPAGLIRTNGRTRLAFHNARPAPTAVPTAPPTAPPTAVPGADPIP